MENITLNVPVLTEKLQVPDQIGLITWIADGTQIFKCRLYFLNLNHVLSAAYCYITCIQFSDFAGEFACDAQFCTLFLFKFDSFISQQPLQFIMSQDTQEKFLMVIKNGSLFAFLNTFQCVTDYFLQQLRKLFEPLLANFRKIIEYSMQFDWICMRPFTSLLKGLR